MSESPKRRFPRGYLYLILAFFVLLGLLYYVCIDTPPLRISEETTRITGPLTPDGQIDFLRYIEETTYPPELATDDNGFRIFVRTFGDIASNDQFYTKQKYRKLGLDVNIPPTMVFPKEPYEILKEKLGEDTADEKRKLLENLWTLDDLPELADWVASMDAPLDAAAEMIRKPVFFFPYLQSEASYKTGLPQKLIDMPLDDLSKFREIARSYRARANYRIAKGNIDGAIEDTITQYQLGRKIGRAGIIVQVLACISIGERAHAIPVSANLNHPPTKEQLLKLQNTINQLPLRQTFVRVTEWERALVLSSVQAFFQGNDDESRPVIDRHRFASFCNVNAVYKRMNAMYDVMLDTNRTEKLERFNHELTVASRSPWIYFNSLTSTSRGKLIANLFLALFLPAADACKGAICRLNCCCNMKQLTLALFLYKTEHGEFPKADWIEKIKPYLGDDYEKFLLCPSCSSADDKGKTNYILVLYDEPPTDQDAFLLIERKTPVSYNQAVVSAKDVSAEINQKPKELLPHTGKGNIAKQNGAVEFYSPFQEQ